jgi:muconolactone delta-isomerase
MTPIDFMAPRKGQPTKANQSKIEKAKEELKAIEAAKKEALLKPGSLKNVWAKFDAYMDSEYWACVVFQSRDQAEAFNRAMGLSPGDRYIDGQKLAKRLGVKLPPDKP